MKKKTLQEKLAARKLHMPPTIPYWLLAYAWKAVFFPKLGVHVEYKVDLKQYKGPYIVVSNHASRLDYIYTGLVFLPHRLNFVAGYNEFFRSHLALIFRMMQVVPKRNFTADIYTIREVSRILKNGGRVILFPEGMSSIGGGNQPCAVGSGKFLKLFGLPVLMTKISGGYLTSTKYCLDERPGRVDVVVDQLFSPEQLKELSAEEIQKALDMAIRNDDYEWNKTAGAEYDGHGQMAKNLHTLLYKCPRCGAEFHMLGQGDILRCEACGNGARLDAKYNLLPLDESCVLLQTPKKWLDWERREVYREIRGRDFLLREKVSLGMLPKDHYLKKQRTSEIVGKGELTMDAAGMHYRGTKNGENFSLDMPAVSLPTFGMCTDVSRFYTFVSGVFYEFYPETPCVEKWLLTAEENHRLAGGVWKNFEDADTYEEPEENTL